MLRNGQQQEKNEAPEAPSPATTAVDAPNALEEASKVPSLPAEPVPPSPASTLEEAPKALAGNGARVTEASLPQEVASEAQKVSQSVSLQPHINICFL